MKIILDSADVESIKRLYDIYPVYGVTTNPSILASVGGKPYDTLSSLREILKNGDLHVETLSREWDKIVEEALRIRERVGENTYIKIPVTEDGLKAIRELKKMNIKTTATAVFTLSQALLASLSGASFVAPYVNRIDNMGSDGVETAIEIEKAFKLNGLETHVIAASFKNLRQIESVLKGGVWGVTISPSLLLGMLNHPGTEKAVKGFEEDWAKLDCGPTL